MNKLLIFFVFLLFTTTLNAIKSKYKPTIESIQGRWYGQAYFQTDYYIKKSKKNDTYRVLDLQNIEGAKNTITEFKNYFEWNGLKAQKTTITKNKIIWKNQDGNKTEYWFRTNQNKFYENIELALGTYFGALFTEFNYQVDKHNKQIEELRNEKSEFENDSIYNPYQQLKLRTKNAAIVGGIGLTFWAARQFPKLYKYFTTTKLDRTLDDIRGVWYTKKGEEVFIKTSKDGKSKVVDLDNIEGLKEVITEEEETFVWKNKKAIKNDYPNNLVWKNIGNDTEVTEWSRVNPKARKFSGVDKGYALGAAASVVAGGVATVAPVAKAFYKGEKGIYAGTFDIHK